MHDATGQYYDTHAEQLAARYRGADVTALHILLRRWLPASGSVLEIGCGIGRESAFMSALGLEVLATDASEPMLSQARLAPGNEHITFQPAAFPLRPGYPLLQARFDAVVAIAVLMHVPDHEVFDLAFQIRGLLNPGGRFVCSFCSGRIPSEEDPRLYADREPGEVRLLFERLGFTFLAKEENEDGLGRATRWTTLVFGCDHLSGARPVDQIEAVINHDKKDATYKLALMRALCDIAQTAYRQVRWHPGDTVSVPLGLLAEKWLYYYWPLVDTGDEPLIPQKRGMEVNKPIAFRKELTALAAHFSLQNGLSRFHGEFRSERLDPEACLLTDAALNKIAETIVAGPVKFSSQGGFMSQGRQSARNRCHTPQALYAALGRVHFNADIWRELCLVGHWISEAIILRWAELTVEISKRQVPITRVLEKLLVRPETDRDVYAVREIYKASPSLACVWTQADLTDRRFDVDHAIPFSLWHNNDLWNLLPADAKVNNEKRDRLVDRETLFSSRETIIGCWQITRHAMPERFDLELSRTLFGRNHAEAQWEIPAFAALTEAVETVALQRGVERWQPAPSAAAASKERASLRLRNAAESESYDAGDSLYQPPPPLPALELDGKRSVAHYHMLPQGRTLLDPAEVPQLAFKSALPIVAELAAGPFFDGFETGQLSDLNELDWIAVPEKLCKSNRFVIRVAGDSMEPLFHIGDLLVFEYHRTPRLNNQIVIAANFTSGAEGGEYAVKRFKADPDHWRFLSENPAYSPAEIPKSDMSHPILGTYVGKL
jgi:phage repressor protein C with HTH and peptisase S24 domain/SAM-dependent methyltransferase